MGTPDSETGRGTDESEHTVSITVGYYLTKFEMTQAQYQSVMRNNPAGLSDAQVIGQETQIILLRIYPGQMLRYYSL